MERPKRRSLLVAKVGVATITYVVLASPIACNLPAPEPVPDTDAQAKDGQSAAPSDANGATNGADR